MSIRIPTIALVMGLSFATQGMAADWQDGGGSDWRNLLESAKSEGTLVVSGTAALEDGLIQAFRKDTGIDVVFLTGGRRESQTRFHREVQSGLPTIDVYLGGLSPFRLKNKGLLAEQRPLLLLPGVVEKSHWIGGDVPFADREDTYLSVPSSYASGLVVVNSDEVDITKIKNWSDLLKPEYKGKIAAHDPRNSGPGQALGSYLVETLGLDFVEDFYKDQDVKLTRDYRQLVDWVARGTYPIAVGAVATNIERYRNQGLDQIKVIQMDDAPGYLVGGSSVAAIPAKAPHPNAAAVFLNWYLSQRGQEAYVDTMQVPSRRTDVGPMASPDYTIPKPDLAYLDQYREDWYIAARPKAKEALISVIGQ